MFEYVAPTKSNLLNLKKSIKIARQGYNLLDKKRIALTHKLTALAPKIKIMQKEFFKAYNDVFKAAAFARLTNGSSKVSLLSNICVEDKDVFLKNKNIIGVSIPVINDDNKNISQNISLLDSTSEVDELIKKVKTAVSISLKIIEIETSVKKLVFEIKKTQKRANALDYILIPKYEEQIKFLESTLEEKEREDFFKVKMVKNKKNRI
ncbi:V-type ATP synthase subunit D [Candidatus Dependentiae bacterium]|nr:V-type ATP synthase subunit D [Candidatus Dependentiae bacterium]